MNDEVNQLLTKYQAHMQAVMEAFRIEATALAWKMAAQIMSDMLPQTVAIGTLSYDGKETKVAVPTVDAEVSKPEPKAKVIKGSGKIKPAKPAAKPKTTAEKYGDLLASKEGVWARRGSRRVQYTCMGWKAVPRGMHPIAYIMKNTKTGKTITVKFDSIVSDWTHHAGNDELQRKAARAV